MSCGQLALLGAPAPSLPALRAEPCDCSTTVLCWGLGADSTAILARILANPPRYGLRGDLSDLIVVTAVVGEEWPDTYDLAEEHILPLLRRYGVRYVQVGRAGPSMAKHGIVVLGDSRSPERIVRRAPWNLGDDLAVSGTLPMYAAGKRLCSIRFKGEVLDRWFEENVQGSRFCHWIGFDALEVGRALRDLTYANPRRHARYPLIEWGWDRPALLGYLEKRFGVVWPKSYCTMCPFPVSAGSIDDHLARARRFPEAIVKAAVLEYVAEALNPRCTLYADSSLRRELNRSKNVAALEALDAELRQLPWTVYEVRRIITPGRTKRCKAAHGDQCAQPGPDCVRKGTAWRSVRSLPAMTREEAMGVLAQSAELSGECVETGFNGISRVVTRRRGLVYPMVEELYVAAPAIVPDKARPGFQRLWETTTGAGMRDLALELAAVPGRAEETGAAPAPAVGRETQGELALWTAPSA
ncbi:hypothetical protein LN042_23070 [Kitasatospora sp. RB6PN24]|uniref:hypothetical protein n=1 Tax=Kitasatospora humi TaxID=2893891 RepID=UPI001E35EFB1|nr:hypothetical protein [Kitasatospora humi]MCC9309918.1 hypothetical protein [Kitasatospora humi]